MIVTMHARQRYIERIDPTATMKQAAAVYPRPAHGAE